MFRSSLASRLLGVFGAAATLLGLAVPIAAAPKKQFLFIHQRTPQANQVFSLAVDKSGTVTPVAGSPFATSAGADDTSGQVQTAAFSARRKLLFVSGKSGVSALRVAADGSLSEVPGSPFGAAASYRGVGVVEKGSATFVYVSDYDNNQLRGFRVAADGALDELDESPYACGTNPSGLTTVRDLVFTADTGSRTVSAFRAASDGDLKAAEGSPHDADEVYITNVFADPAGSCLYVNSDVATTMRGFRINKTTAALTLFSSPVSLDLTSQGAGLGAGKKLVFAPGTKNYTGNGYVHAFKRVGNGELTSLGPSQDLGPGVINGCALDAKGKVLAVCTSYAVRTYQAGKDGQLLDKKELLIGLPSPTQVLFVSR